MIANGIFTGDCPLVALKALFGDRITSASMTITWAGRRRQVQCSVTVAPAAEVTSHRSHDDARAADQQEEASP